MAATLNRALQNAKPVQWLRQLWQVVRQWWLGFRREVETRVPALVERLRRRTGGDNRQAAARPQGKDLRDRIFYHYFTTLDRARDEGFERRGDQTPYEYEQTLMTELPADLDALGDLTDTFVVARYSGHAVSEAMVRRADETAREVQRALRRRAEEKSEDS
jgi:hypothetical protein